MKLIQYVVCALFLWEATSTAEETLLEKVYPERESFSFKGMEFVKVEPGTLEGPRKQIELPLEYWVAKYELREIDWDRVIGNYQLWCKRFNRDRKEFGKNRPVTHISYREAKQFCARLDQMTKKSSGGGNPKNLMDRIHNIAAQIVDTGPNLQFLKEDYCFRLPTGAEWEFACLAGAKTKYHFGDSITISFATKEANVFQPSTGFGPFLREVGCYPPNAWGIFDMHGNVSEWCLDFRLGHFEKGEYPFRNKVGMVEPILSFPRQMCILVKGGNYFQMADYAAAKSESFGIPNSFFQALGVRVVYAKSLPDLEGVVAPDYGEEYNQKFFGKNPNKGSDFEIERISLDSLER